jgi:transcriptional regulator with XRE-family HTH domain
MIFEILGFGREHSGSIPNRLTNGMGKIIKQARHEAGMSQAELARLAYLRQASISDIENGKREVSSSEIIYLSNALRKPITYFFPPPFNKLIDTDTLPTLIQELVLQAERLSDDDLRRLTVQARALVDLAENSED